MTQNNRAWWPQWAKELQERFIAGEAGIFILHGNVRDCVQHEKGVLSCHRFIVEHLLQNKDVVVTCSLRHGGTHYEKASKPAGHTDDSLMAQMHRLDAAFKRSTPTHAVTLPYAQSLLPNAETTFLSTEERALLEMIHDWALEGELLKNNHLLVLVCESLTDVHASLLSNPKVSTIEIAMPDEPARFALIGNCAASMPSAQAQAIAKHTAGLRLLEIESIVSDQAGTGMSPAERKALIEKLLKGQTDAGERAEKLAAVTSSMSAAEIEHLIAGQTSQANAVDAQNHMLATVFARKRALIESRCAGLIEFLESSYGLEAVGGMEPVKAELLRIAATLKSGAQGIAPMGVLAVGPMGAGKTFVIKAFLKEVGLPGVVLKNFRSKWVGSTESNLEKVFKIIQAMGPIALIIDEGDRSFGGDGHDGDGGTSSRVIARIKEFMSDTSNRGRVLTIVMTNRPDKLDTDIKRPGRLDQKIPFFYAQTAQERVDIFFALQKRYLGSLRGVPATQRDGLIALAEKMSGYSNADIEQVVIQAIEHARRDAKASELQLTDIQYAIEDFIPPQNLKMIRLMELLAVQEASRRSLLPEAYKHISAEALDQEIRRLKLEVR